MAANRNSEIRNYTRRNGEIEEMKAAIEIVEAVEALEAEVISHQEAYQAGKPVISDAEYDALTRKLEAIKPHSRALERIGTADGEVEHEAPMLSLKKAYSSEAVEDWVYGFGRSPHLMASHKLDGVACSLKYEHGKLVCASTRGDGHKGQNITANVMAAVAIPKTLTNGSTVEVRGELVLRKADYGKLGISKSGRNSVAGAVNGKVTDITKALHFVAYDMVLNEDETVKFKLLKRFGFEVAKHRSISCRAIDKAIEDLSETGCDYEIDGIVFKLENAEQQAKAGATKHHPKGAIAFKFGTETAKTVVTDIEITVGKTGKQTPVVYFNQVTMSGATISKASAGSLATLEKLGIKVGDTIEIERKGGVIPKIVRVLCVRT